MSTDKPSAAIPFATAHMGARHIDLPSVDAIRGYPGWYAVDFGSLDLHLTPERWDAIDTAVRAGIAAAESKTVAS